MTSRVPDVFSALARQLNIDEADFMVMHGSGMNTADEFFFRLPDNEKMEAWLMDTMRLRTCVNPIVDGPPVWTEIDRIDAVTNTHVTEVAFSRGSLAASVRRLWAASKAASQKDLSRVADDAQFGVPSKISTAVVANLCSKAAARGVRDFDEHERPGQSAVSAVMQNFRHSGPWSYLAWELFVSEEEERHQHLLRGERRGKIRMELTAEGSLEGVADDAALRRARVNDLLAMQDCLVVRAVVHEWLEIVSLECYERLHKLYVSRFRKRQPEKMRGPTLGEIRQTDRMLHEEVLHYASRGTGTLEQGILWHLDNPSKVWRLLDGQTADVPDQSVESAKRPRLDPGTASEARCFICGLTRREHASGNFCRPEGSTWTDRSSGSARPKGKGKDSPGRGKGKGKEKKGSSKPGQGRGKDASVPDFMRGCAQRSAPSRDWPNGQPFCWGYHNPNRQGCPGGCNKCHLCPRFEGSGVCLQQHALYNH